MDPVKRVDSFTPRLDGAVTVQRVPGGIEDVSAVSEEAFFKSVPTSVSPTVSIGTREISFCPLLSAAQLFCSTLFGGGGLGIGALRRWIAKGMLGCVGIKRLFYFIRLKRKNKYNKYPD
ncbi:MAG: hypothetical protein GY737_00160 [Desulfobacteraceae bacterium]|nr:hypothetical protein [Desulfobacteraceae bacterium]